MSLLADLAARTPGLQGELTGTEALGIILRHRTAADLVTAGIRVGAPHLPDGLHFSTQAADASGRPDLVARDDVREVLHVEGKFWFGLTDAQADGAYLHRLHAEHSAKAPQHPHVGALVFVCPPRRSLSLWRDLVTRYCATGEHSVGEWRFATTPTGAVLGLVDWQTLLEPLESSSERTVSEDARQLRGLVDRVDSWSFVPWTTQQLTDQDVARRIIQLVGLVNAINDAALKGKVAEPTTGRIKTIKLGALVYGKRFLLGGVSSTLMVGMQPWADHGASPLWLRFWTGAPVVRKAYGSDVVELHKGCGLPVPIQAGALHDAVVDDVVEWLRGVSVKLDSARPAVGLPAGAVDAEPEDADDES